MERLWRFSAIHARVSLSFNTKKVISCSRMTNAYCLDFDRELKFVCFFPSGSTRCDRFYHSIHPPSCRQYPLYLIVRPQHVLPV